MQITITSLLPQNSIMLWRGRCTRIKGKINLFELFSKTVACGR